MSGSLRAFTAGVIFVTIITLIYAWGVTTYEDLTILQIAGATVVLFIMLIIGDMVIEKMFGKVNL